jgi:hypothetical protein
VRNTLEIIGMLFLCIVAVVAGIALIFTYIAAIGAAFGVAFGALAGAAVWVFRQFTGG